MVPSAVIESLLQMLLFYPYSSGVLYVFFFDGLRFGDRYCEKLRWDKKVSTQTQNCKHTHTHSLTHTQSQNPGGGR